MVVVMVVLSGEMDITIKVEFMNKTKSIAC